MSFVIDWIGCTENIAGSTGTFHSPNYPHSYGHSNLCEWAISVDSGFSVELTFLDFDVQQSPNCSLDFVQVNV